MDDGSASRTPDSPARFCSDFAAELRRRRVSVRRAAELTHWGKSTISSACNGHTLPKRDLVEDVLRGVGVGDELEGWLTRYDQIANPGDVGSQRSPDGPAAETAPHRRLSRRVLGAAVGVVVLLAGGIWLWLALHSAPNGTDGDHSLAESVAALRGQPHSTVIVQNMYASGPSGLHEDRSLSYLSSRPVARCANNGCKLPGTEMSTGAAITAICHIQGELLTNADISSPGIKTNPNASASALWYEIIWPDGRRGYISEVYLAPAYRGGLSLPPC
ncbi:helix-turn-helix domain-containing protein [Amycolatopsis sp. NPDC004625]|uniref:helix-turn-helix domain-containing protein n=1 Tax=Amycolatopsis sp. NPDC004625 TaxID=3154670 RepID=UPI00339ED2CB